MANKSEVEIVKRQLWRNGVRAKDVSGAGLGFDLVANDTFKVRVELDTKGKKHIAAPDGVIVAAVREHEVVYYTCGGGVCTETGISKLFKS